MGRKKIVNYVKASRKKLFEQKIGPFQVFVHDALPEEVNVEHVLQKTQDLLPDHVLGLVDVIYIGNFSLFKDRNINASYIDGALYISSKQDNNFDMLDDIIHELAHAVEEEYSDFLYDDEKIKNEYFGKLRKLRNYLSFEGYNIRDVNFYNEKYNSKFDEFLQNEVGYDKLSGFTNGLFLDPYSCTSMREYFATGFESFFLQQKQGLLKNTCPYLYKKIYVLVENNPKDIKYEHEM